MKYIGKLFASVDMTIRGLWEKTILYTIPMLF